MPRMFPYDIGLEADIYADTTKDLVEGEKTSNESEIFKIELAVFVWS